MTQDEIKKALHCLHFQGKWSIRGLARECGLSPSTIVAAMTTQVTEQKQARLSNVIPLIKKRAAPKKKTGPKATKRKPGHLKRYLIRYYNLMGWLKVIEQEKGISKKFGRKKQGGMSRDRAAYVCHRLDYQMKKYLLDLFGEVLKQRKIVMGDCFACEKWIERIHKKLPGLRPALFKKLMQRGQNERAMPYLRKASRL